MTATGRVLRWEDLARGLAVSVPFTVDETMLRAFIDLSGDNSRIHRDAAFARHNGFADRVVHGALQVAQLSYLVGMHLPGDLGLATSWQIDFRTPLYVGDNARMDAEVSHLSEATRIVKIKFSVMVGERLVATGTAQSRLLDDIAPGDTA
jgi:acyl dehydratase